jgi:5'-deoxynucleotidase YfbR-like HD superfamily hydrolase
MADYDHRESDRGPWIQTYTGRAFYIKDPSPEDIDIEDIGHALSNLCRFTGHARRFYSVAEHSVLVALHVADRGLPLPAQFAALMHDATEAYLGDVSRPLKHAIAGYKEMEAAVERAVAERFAIDFGRWHEAIKEADNAVLLAERIELMERPSKAWLWSDGLKQSGQAVRAMTPDQAKHLFMMHFRELEYV